MGFEIGYRKSWNFDLCQGNSWNYDLKSWKDMEF